MWKGRSPDLALLLTVPERFLCGWVVAGGIAGARKAEVGVGYESLLLDAADLYLLLGGFEVWKAGRGYYYYYYYFGSQDFCFSNDCYNTCDFVLVITLEYDCFAGEGESESIIGNYYPLLEDITSYLAND